MNIQAKKLPCIADVMLIVFSLKIFVIFITNILSSMTLFFRTRKHKLQFQHS